MTSLKERNYSYDAVRGFCMFLIPFQHFIATAGADKTGAGLFIYAGIDFFVLQVFFFIAGVFSKKPEHSQDTAFQGIMWPYLIGSSLIYLSQFLLFGSFTDYPFADTAYGMWFLLALFFFKVFQKYYVKIPGIVGLAFLLYLLSGASTLLSVNALAISRTFSFFIFFILGCSFKIEDTKKLTSLKWWQTTLLGIFLLGVVALFSFKLPYSFVRALRLKNYYGDLDFYSIEGIGIRLLIFVLSILWIVFLMNLFPSKKGMWSYIGSNTMPLYVFHVIIRMMIKKWGIAFGLIDIPNNNWIIVGISFIFAVICTAVFTSRPFVKLYDFIMDGSYKLATILVHKFLYPINKILEGLILIPIKKLLNNTSKNEA